MNENQDTLFKLQKEYDELFESNSTLERDFINLKTKAELADARAQKMITALKTQNARLKEQLVLAQKRGRR